MGTLVYFLREVLINLRRSPLVTLSAITTVMVLQLILGTFALMWLNLDHWTRSFTQQVQVVVFLQDQVDEAAQDQVQRAISQVGHVVGVKFVDRDTAFEQLQKELKGKVTLDDLGDNPLPDRFDVRVDEAKFLAPVADKLRRLPHVYKVKYGGDIAKRLVKLSTTVTWVGTLLSILLGLATLTVVGNTIRLTVFARRREIEIMQMVGAARWFIQVPFVVEGILQSLVGSLLALLVLGSAYTNVVIWLQDSLPFLPTLSSELMAQSLVPALLTLGLAVGALGSLVSVNRYLKI
jgi:cell division transport system permease protein